MKINWKLAAAQLTVLTLLAACANENKTPNLTDAQKLNAAGTARADVATLAPSAILNTSADVSSQSKSAAVHLIPLGPNSDLSAASYVQDTGVHKHFRSMSYARVCNFVHNTPVAGTRRDWMNIVHREPTAFENELLKQALCDTEAKRAANLFCREVRGSNQEIVFAQYGYFNFRPNPHLSGGRSLMQCKDLTSVNPSGAFVWAGLNNTFIDDVNICGQHDPNIPKLSSIFKDFESSRNNPSYFNGTYRVARTLHTNPPTPNFEQCVGYEDSISALALRVNEFRDASNNVVIDTIEVPTSGYRVDKTNDFQATVLYANTDEGTITLKYGYSDSVADGYTVYIENICIDPYLQAAFDSCTPVVSATGERRRNCMVQVKGNERIASALGGQNHVKVAIRRDGRWMDPRCRQLWQ